MNEQRICLDGPLAKGFMQNKVGDKVRMTVDAVVVGTEMRNDYMTDGPGGNGKNKKPPPKIPHVEMVIAKVNGQAGKSVDEYSDSEMESAIEDAKEPSEEGE